MKNAQQRAISDADLKTLRSWMSGAFYQTWDLDEEGGMVEVVEREFCHTDEASEEMIKYLNGLIKLISDIPEVSELIGTVTGDYDPLFDGMESIEWLVLLKQYLRGDKDVFNGIDCRVRTD
ncbi:hypothetical protein KUV86_01475 [Halomonas sp. DP8Y7-3]|uniref:hypothetical protein n=1 Tax=Halomonas sp. DP8Y7-3 TaxID=2859079 RepID=UPI001C94C92C|nr:hypothetical protein [Halomonas sp. DP8Y7-3]MBY5927779.1 hypothetical protein [Halomonas sp. DP8Y7-3]